MEMVATYILLDILLSCHDGRLAHLEPHLRRWIAHEAAECIGLHVIPSAAALPRLPLALPSIAVAIAGLLRL